MYLRQSFKPKLLGGEPFFRRAALGGGKEMFQLHLPRGHITQTRQQRLLRQPAWHIAHCADKL